MSEKVINCLSLSARQPPRERASRTGYQYWKRDRSLAFSIARRTAFRGGDLRVSHGGDDIFSLPFVDRVKSLVVYLMLGRLSFLFTSRETCLLLCTVYSIRYEPFYRTRKVFFLASL